MLQVSNRKLCPLLSLVLTFMGCGKKMSDDSASDAGVLTQTQEIPSALILKLETSSGPTTSTDIPKNGTTYLPERLWVTQGNGSGKTAVVSYNIVEGTSNYEFRCTYHSTVETKELPLVNCEDNRGGAFSDLAFNVFPLYYGRKIKMELKGAYTSGLVIESVHSVDWK